MPVERQAGDWVIGGTINGTGTLLIRVTAVGGDSFLQRVAREVEDARALKPGLLHLVDRILRVYTPAVLTIALLSFAGWRSEEHTSELQSLMRISYAVFCLKKKNTIT